ncbi:hypothetical protein HanRHA438_Chr05g0203701 [Helianthus annuus]|nr:hypothetical protein HanRHA438_Chr05g0203701 [Helianthus annuus]
MTLKLNRWYHFGEPSVQLQLVVNSATFRVIIEQEPTAVWVLLVNPEEKKFFRNGIHQGLNVVLFQFCQPYEAQDQDCKEVGLMESYR